MKKFIVCTSINPPTAAIKGFDSLPDWKLIVVGDLKTPGNYKLKNGLYLSPKDQERLDSELSQLIGWNSIQRRNFGFILAYRLGAEIIATVDDDNIPTKDWGDDLLIGKYISTKTIHSKDLVADPFFATEYNHLWHRGFPLQLIENRKKSHKIITKRRKTNYDIQADFWNGDPDIDSVCRAAFKPECNFSEESFPFASNPLSPFNSQNTFFTRKVFPHYFLFPHIGRMDDIWASYYLQSIGFKVIYGKPTVFQVRNPHSLAKDFEEELIGFEHNISFIESLKVNPNNALKKFLPPKSLLAFNRYRSLF